MLRFISAVRDRLGAPSGASDVEMVAALDQHRAEQKAAAQRRSRTFAAGAMQAAEDALYWRVFGSGA